jgi:hypothetical protein
MRIIEVESEPPEEPPSAGQDNRNRYDREYPTHRRCLYAAVGRFLGAYSRGNLLWDMANTRVTD